MKNLKRVATTSKTIVQHDRSTWLPLYYDIENDAVYTNPGDGRYLLTELIRPCSEEEIRESVHEMMAL